MRRHRVALARGMFGAVIVSVSTTSYFVHHTQMISKAACVALRRASDHPQDQGTQAVKQTYLRVGLATAVAEAVDAA